MTTASHPTFLGIRRAAFLETLLILAVLIVLDLLFFQGDRFFTVEPHPFWIPVILVAVQYGAGAGIMAALAASAALLIGNMPVQQVDQDYYAHLFAIVKRPVLWVFVATVIGSLRQRHIYERDDLKQALAEAGERENTIADAYERTKTLKEGLETRIAGQMRTATQTYLAAKSMEKLRVSEMLSGVEPLVRSVMNPEKFSLFLMQNGALEAVIRSGWTGVDQFSPRFSQDSRLFEHVVARRRALCIVSDEDERLLDGEGVLAGALIHPQTNEVLGMLKIESLGFTGLNLSTIEEFRALCEWVALSYVNARTHEKTEATSVVNHENSLLSHGFFQRQVEFVCSLGQRAKFDVSLVVVKLVNPGEFPEDKLRIVAQSLNEAIQESLRQIDQVFEHQRGNTDYAVLLPNTPAKNAQVVVDKIKAGLERKLGASVRRARFSYAVQPLLSAADALATPRRGR